MEPSAPPILLCIDDDPLQHRIVERLLQEFVHTKYTFDSATSYDEGLAKLSGGQATVCLLDYWLDRGTGIDLLREARRVSLATPTIMPQQPASRSVTVVPGILASRAAAGAARPIDR